MAHIALDPAYRRVTVEEFLAMDFGDAKAELEDGLIYMMAGGSEVHARIAANIIIALGTRLRGTGCRPYGSDFAMRTVEGNIRFPDVSVYCNDPTVPEKARKQLLGDPCVVFEILSSSTASHDQLVKVPEFRALEGVRDIVLVDPERERIRLITRTPRGGWSDEWIDSGEPVTLGSLDLSIPHAEFFA